MKYELDPLCSRALEAQAETATAWGNHPQDHERWMGVFEELARQGGRWGPDDILYWFEEHWPHADARHVHTLCAYADMALARETSDGWLEVGAAVVQEISQG